MNKIWQNPRDNSPLNPTVEKFTIDEDYKLDVELLPYDIDGTLGHIAALSAAEIITFQEEQQLHKTLLSIKHDWSVESNTFPDGIEDSHSYIEYLLTEDMAELGQKVHTGRSRNDQVLTALRLYQRAQLEQVESSLQHLKHSILAALPAAKEIGMPGYSHGRQGMVVSIGLWLGSFAELFWDDMRAVRFALQQLDRSPLGAGAGFGNGLNLHRGLSAKTLGFGTVQDNPLACMASRGKDELLCLQTLSQIAITAGKFASDLLLFTSDHYGFFSLPETMLTGSSMMPHKQNYDLLELVRANAGIINGYTQEVAGVISGLGSGYHRDFQLTKAPLMKGFKRVQQTLEILIMVVENLSVHEDNITSSIQEGAHQTAKVLDLVKDGTSFRAAYHDVKKDFEGTHSDNGNSPPVIAREM